MSMSQPLEPELGRADEENPGGLPSTAPGDHADPPDDPPTGDDLPFRTPDPRELGPT
jgi:hypothetical protein